MYQPIETWIHENKKITLNYDEHCQYLYEDLWQDEVTFISNHREYDSQGPLKTYDLEEIDLEEYEIIPITAYIHSGVALYIGNCKPCPWDSGCFGHIIFKKGIFGENNQGLKSFVSEWENILNGQVFWIGIYDEIKLYDYTGKYHSSTWELTDSVGGFIFHNRKDMFEAIKEYFGIDLNN